MERRSFLQSLAAATASPALAQQQSRTSKPNVIWLLGDQHRGQALSCMGDPNVHTPNIDSMASMGTNFTRAISGFPLCCPFRGSMLTGRYAHHCVPGHEYPLPDGQPTLTEPLKAAGYQTAYFGKWHLAGFHESQGRASKFITNPDKRGGFDQWTGYENNNSQYDSWVHGGRGKDAFHYRLPGYETDALTDLLVRYIRDRGAEAKQSPAAAKPFFAALSVQPPHNPYVAPAEYSRRHNPTSIQLRPNVARSTEIEDQARRDLAGYYAQIENWDFNVGRVVDALREQNLLFNTHILFFADHGDMHGSQGQFKKMTPYEESIRIPFLIAGEQPTYDGRVTSRPPIPINAVDIAPTTLGLCGIAKPSWMDGTDWSHYRVRPQGAPAARRQSEPDSAFIQCVVPTMHADSVNKPWRGVVTRDGWKYVCLDGTSWMLFNLNDDPYEMANLALNSKYKAERGRLIKRLQQWVADTGDKFNIPAD
ncbi:MAG: sulfatase [Bryobacteraceae bacterium]|nr:sulfatase [Bryobacteraceae bacterium]